MSDIKANSNEHIRENAETAARVALEAGSLLAGLAGSVVVTRILGVLSGAVLLTSLVYKAASKNIQKQQAKKKLSDIKATNLSAAESPEAADKAMDKLFEAEIEEDKHHLIALLYSALPFLGLRLAGEYLLKNVATEQERKEISPEAYAVGKGVGRLLGGKLQRKFFYPLSSKVIGTIWSKIYNRGIKGHDINRMPVGYNRIEIPLERGDNKEHKIRAYISSPTDEENIDTEKPTALLFHGNAQTSEDMEGIGNDYKKLGFNVMMVTMGGYPGSDKGLQTSETSTYQDANAAVEYLKGQGVSNIVTHGLSIGSSLAFAAAKRHPDVVKCVVTDQGMGSGANVAANLLKNILGPMTPGSVIRVAVSEAFPVGEEVPGVTIDGKPLLTDGLDNVRKAASLECPVICVKAEKDIMMGKGQKKDGTYKSNFAKDILLARYGAETDEKVFVTPESGHCASDAMEIQQVKDSLQEIFFEGKQAQPPQEKPPEGMSPKARKQLEF